MLPFSSRPGEQLLYLAGGGLLPLGFLQNTVCVGMFRARWKGFWDELSSVEFAVPRFDLYQSKIHAI